MNNKIIIAGIVVFSLILIIGSYFLFAVPNNKQSKTLSYSSQDKDRPIVKVKETSKDFGKIKLSDNPEVIFTLKNAGTKPLQLSGISTSCGCTAAQIIYNGTTSREYSMHFKEDDTYEIAPQTEAKVKIIYRPSTMPVYGLVEREVYITTNDPNHKRLVFKIQAVIN